MAPRRTRPWVLIVVVATACSSMTGCAVVQAARLPPKKNLNVLAEGTPRTRVIAELGAPVWSGDSAGQKSDVFTFKQGYGKPVKIGRVLTHATADFFTFGLWEFVGTPSEMVFDGSDVKVNVNYDDRDRVTKIDVIEGAQVVENFNKPLIRWPQEESKDVQLAAEPSPTTR